MMTIRVSACVALVVGLSCAALSCSRGGDSGGSTPPASSNPSNSSKSAPKGTLALGERISLPMVPLADIAKNPARYENALVATGGKVTAVCQEMGCWMELEDESGHAHVKMHGHQFFVPKTASGHVARVQAKVLAGTDEHCDDSPPPPHAVAHIELDATGVELD